MFYKYDNEWKRYDLVRFAKGTTLTKNSSKMLISIHFGWVVPEQIIFRDRENIDSYTVKLLSSADWRFDLALLFQDEVS